MISLSLGSTRGQLSMDHFASEMVNKKENSRAGASYSSDDMVQLLKYAMNSQSTIGGGVGSSIEEMFADYRGGAGGSERWIEQGVGAALDSLTEAQDRYEANGNANFVHKLDKYDQYKPSSAVVTDRGIYEGAISPSVSDVTDAAAELGERAAAAEGS